MSAKQFGYSQAHLESILASANSERLSINGGDVLFYRTKPGTPGSEIRVYVKEKKSDGDKQVKAKPKASKGATKGKSPSNSKQNTPIKSSVVGSSKTASQPPVKGNDLLFSIPQYYTCVIQPCGAWLTNFPYGLVLATHHTPSIQSHTILPSHAVPYSNIQRSVTHVEDVIMSLKRKK